MHHKTEEKHEYCAVCDKITDYAKDTPIMERLGYIEGGGQLCKDCYYELYINKKSGSMEFLES